MFFFSKLKMTEDYFFISLSWRQQFIIFPLDNISRSLKFALFNKENLNRKKNTN